jgi:hypothetical protein
MEKRIYAIERRINILEYRATEAAQNEPKLDWRADVAKSRAKLASRIPSR